MTLVEKRSDAVLREFKIRAPLDKVAGLQQLSKLYFSGLRPNVLNLSWIVIFLLGTFSFLACLLVAVVLHEPVPRVHDEFSYLVMADTFAHDRVSNPAPPLPEFFETFHVLLKPAYVSKYFPMQGALLAVGATVTGHASVGIWLGSALAVATTTWMLESWIGVPWALLGGCLMALQYGIFSYWSQTYWGGMAAALGGALFFGSIRRLWDRFSWRNAVWLAMGLMLLANSRPLEGLLTVAPAAALFLHSFWTRRRWTETGVWRKFLVPSALLLASAAFAMGAYNRAITGSAFKTPYALQEQQYQESSPFLFLPPRPQLTYTSFWLRQYYHVQEFQQHYLAERNPRAWPWASGRKIATWWDFYCGLLLSIPLFLPPLLRRDKVRWFQAVFLLGFGVLAFTPERLLAWHILVDLLAVLEIGILWVTFNEFWSRLAIATCTLLLFEQLTVKWFFPHYFAPAACLVIFLQTQGLQQIWNWKKESSSQPQGQLSRAERRRIERENKKNAERQAPSWNLRWVVYALPVACLVSLVMNVEGRLHGTLHDIHGPIRQALLMDDWSLDRANIDHWLEQQQKPQLVFVRYSPRHNVNYEWVYNHPDIMHSHVMWARDLGAEHNKLLLNLVPDRTAWLIEADRRHPQLIPYEEAAPQPATLPAPANSPASTEQND